MRPGTAQIKGIRASNTICFMQFAFEAFSFEGMKKRVSKDRRSSLKAAAAVGAASLVDFPDNWSAADGQIKVGGLFSLTGTTAIIKRSLNKAGDSYPIRQCTTPTLGSEGTSHG